MLYEIRNIRQNEGEPRRRWFIDDYFDLVVWLNDNEEIQGFQLCYNKSKNQHALTWHRDTGYMHNRVDSGEDKPGKPKGIPILVTDGFFDYEQIADLFKRESKYIDDNISELIYKKILEYSTSSFRKDRDKSAVRQAALDYIEGRLEGNAAKVERSIHPELARRGIFINPKTSETCLEQMSAMSLIKTIGIAGKPKENHKNEVVILDISENTASVRAETPDGVDYLHIAKFNGKWMIVNILRESKSEKE
ncbi:MAG: hypothetical protein BWK80_24760 [Desulfobacteraceae bacterium IS3]|nr:MAG: hypothetical protein BWK80_24760 [Desulfobacteraceae bacterium IS3]